MFGRPRIKIADRIAVFGSVPRKPHVGIRGMYGMMFREVPGIGSVWRRNPVSNLLKASAAFPYIRTAAGSGCTVCAPPSVSAKILCSHFPSCVRLSISAGSRPYTVNFFDMRVPEFKRSYECRVAIERESLYARPHDVTRMRLTRCPFRRVQSRKQTVQVFPLFL